MQCESSSNAAPEAGSFLSLPASRSATPEGRSRSKRSVKPEDEDTPEDALTFGTSLDRFISSETPAKRRSTRISTSGIKLEDDTTALVSSSQIVDLDVEPDEPSTPPLMRASPKSRTSSSKKRKVMDTGQYQGMQEVPDRLAEDLDSQFARKVRRNPKSLS